MDTVRLAQLSAVGFAAAIIALAQPANAQETRVVVPDEGYVGGCYRVKGQIYGPYRLAFCLGHGNYYQVVGGGLHCEGGLNWYMDRNRDSFYVTLERSRCGQGAAWSADHMRCYIPEHGFEPPEGFPGFNRDGPSAQVVVPDDGGGHITEIRCHYFPRAEGYEATWIDLRQIGNSM